MSKTLFEGYPPAWRITKEITSPLNPFYQLVSSVGSTHILDQPLAWQGKTYRCFNRIHISVGSSYVQFCLDTDSYRPLGQDPLFINYVFLGHRLGLTIQEIVHMANVLCRKTFEDLEPIYHGPTSWEYVELPDDQKSLFEWIENMDESQYRSVFVDAIRSRFDDLARYSVCVPIPTIAHLGDAIGLYRYAVSLDTWTQADLIYLYNPTESR